MSLDTGEGLFSKPAGIAVYSAGVLLLINKGLQNLSLTFPKRMDWLTRYGWGIY